MHDIFRETGANIQLLNPEQSISHGPAQAGDEAAQIRHDQSDGRNKGDQEQCHDHGGEQRHDVLGNALDLDLADAAANEQAGADGRSDGADTQVHDEHDAELDIAHADAAGDGQEDRGEDQNGRSQVQEHAHDQQEAVNTAFNYLKANGNRISGAISTSTKDYIINYQDLQGIGMTDKLALPTLIALCSIALGKPVVSNLAVLGDITISGTMIKVDELANTLQVCLDSGAKKVLIPSTSFVDFASVPADLMSAFQLIPYQSAEDAVFKALGVE